MKRQLKAGVSFQEYVSYDIDVVTYDGEEEGGKSEPPATFPSALEGTDAVRNYLMKFNVDYNTMASLSNIENGMYRVHQRVKKQQLTSMDMRKK
jgi:hypothetical protein